MKIRRSFKQAVLNIGLFAFISILFCGCGLSLSTVSYDDVYSTSDDEIYLQEKPVKRNGNLVYQDSNYQRDSRVYRELVTEPSEVETESAGEVATEDYSQFDEDDYYDYAYTARIRRFYRPIVYVDYYADYYTDMYWYTYDPFYWGTSIYLGYSWWYPSYYARWYDPFYWSFYRPWYYNPYWHGHWCCNPWYHHHYDICYFNSRDHNSNLYRNNPTGGSIRGLSRGLSNAGYVETTSLKKNLSRGSNVINGTSSANSGLKRADNMTKPTTMGNKQVSSLKRNNGNTTSTTRKLAKPNKTFNSNSTLNKQNNLTTQKNTIKRNNNSYNPPTTRNRSSNSTINRRNYNNNRSISTPSRSMNRSSSISAPSRSSSRSFSTGRSSSSGTRTLRR